MALLDLTGQKYNKLTALYPTGEKSKYGKNAIWFCRCDCGNYTTANTGSLRCGVKKSCGCAAVEHARNLNRTHNGRHERLYLVWMDMRRRCRDPKNKYYKHYGGRGISVCEQWNSSYEAFREWAMNNGYDKDAKRGKCTLDRINTNGNYEPDNCRWVDAVVQCNNKRNNFNITYGGKTQSCRAWERELGFNKNVIFKRIKSGWSIERALTEKPRVIKRNVSV